MITVEFLKEQGVEESKHEAIINAYNSSVNKLSEDHKVDKASAVKSMMDGIDNVLFEKTNIKRNDNEKTVDYALRSIGDLKKSEFETKINELSSVKAELEEKLKKGIKDDELKSKYDLLEKTLNDERKSWGEEKDKMLSEQSRFKKEIELKSLLPKLKSEFPESYINHMVSGAMGQILDKEIFDDKDGKKMIKGDESNSFTNISVEDFFKQQLKDIIDEKHVQTGTGQQGGGNGDIGIGISEDDTPIVKEQKIRQYLASQKIDKLHPDYSAKFTELRKKYILKK